MPDHRDPVDSWLDARIEPLAPPPGTFERITRRARRRKTGRALTSVAGAAIVVAAAIATPGIVANLRGQPVSSNRPTAQGTQSPLDQSGSARNPNSQHIQFPPAGAALSATSNGSAVPPNFRPTSVTFVSTQIGAVIGQAGTPGQCATNYCTSLAGTSDYGASWYGVNAPVAGPPDGSSGISQLRFLNIRDGWAFGPALWVTHDGGGYWTQENMPGLRVIDLETAGDRAFALLASCSGTGQDYAAGCTSMSLYSSLAGSDQWTPVPGPTQSLQPATPQLSSASLVLTAGRGYILAPSGELFSGPLNGAAWTVADPAVPCLSGSGGPAGQPPSVLLAADSAGLVMACTAATVVVPANSTQVNTVFESSDGGQNWSPAGSPPAAAGTPVSLAAQAGVLLLATDAGIYRSVNGGLTWQQAQPSPAGAPSGQRGFSYVGMTSTQNGVALPADPSLHEVFTTSNGGLTWQARAVSAP
jgi:hypothetical protein